MTDKPYIATVTVSDEWIIEVIAKEIRESDGRVRYKYEIRSKNGGEVFYKSDDLRSGCQGGTAQEGLCSLLSFLGAAAESYDHTNRGGTSDNDDLFPPKVMEWASEHSNEIAMLSCELERDDG